MMEPQNKRVIYAADICWTGVSGRTVGLQPVSLQSLSELERVRLQEVALCRLLQCYDLGCQVTIPKDGQKHKKSLRRKLDSLSKEKSKDKDNLPQAFGIPLALVIANDRVYKQRLDSGQREKEEQGRREGWGDEVSPLKDANSDLAFSFQHMGSTAKLSSSNSSLSSTCEIPTEPSPPPPPPPSMAEAGQRIHRRGGVSVDCITDLDDNQSRLLEALQLSLPAEAPSNAKKHRDKKLSLNPIYRQVPRVMDCCCQHLEKNGLQTVGIFRVGSSRKRVKQLRQEFDQGQDVVLDDSQCIHDVAALLKEFLRDMPDSLLTRELYTAFINSMLLDNSDQVSALQLLIYLLPPCNSDTLQRLLHFLSTVAAHADDGLAADGTEITGNKMTPLNLATIFGPNLLHKKSSDKEFAVQSFLRAEESSAIIGVVRSLISNYQTLFMVPSDLQSQVLMSVVEMDPDVLDYLLRRKDSQYASPSLLRPAAFCGAFPLRDRRSSSSSHQEEEEDSSGEVSPYDNNSPVLSDHWCHRQGLPDSHFRPAGDYCGGRADANAGQGHLWGDWHTRLSQELQDAHLTGSHGDASEHGSRERLLRRRGNGPPAVKRTQSSLGAAGDRPRLPLTRCNSSPNVLRPPLHRPGGQSGGTPSSEDRARAVAAAVAAAEAAAVAAARTDVPGSRCHLKGGEGRDGGTLPHRVPAPLRDGDISNWAPSPPASSVPPGDRRAVAPPEAPPEPPRAPGEEEEEGEGESEGEGERQGESEGEGERWQVGPLLSTDSAAGALPESLV